MAAYYNEIDPFAAAWLRQLIDAGHIAPGVVDERSIEDVIPDELAGYTQCHFFAGIGVWSHALRQAGWPDDRPIWTGSCPCQPFSAAGKGAGFADERHVWPAFLHLIKHCRPPIVLGEQVASKDGLAWLDLVSADVEGEGYAFGATDLCAAGVGAPHIRQRSYWVANAYGQGSFPGSQRSLHSCEKSSRTWDGELERPGSVDRLDHDHDPRPQGHAGNDGAASGREEPQRPASEAGVSGGMADAELHDGRADEPKRGPQGRVVDGRRGEDVRLANAEREQHNGSGNEGSEGQAQCGRDDASRPAEHGHNRYPGPVNGFWEDADWLFCRDGKWRAVKSIIKSLANGLTSGMVRVCDENIEVLEKEIADACGRDTDPRKALYDLWRTLPAISECQWKIGGQAGIPQAEVLFYFLFQLSREGWHFAQSIPCQGAEIHWSEMRMLRGEEAPSCSSCGRGLDQQHSIECADPMRVLPSILARHAQAAWGEAIGSYAIDCAPLIQGATNRVGRLRGYGNAIVAQVAQTFIESVMESV